MRSHKGIQISKLNTKMDRLGEALRMPFPQNGWIHNIRSTLNITLRQLGTKLNMSKQGVKKIEEREASGTITINALREAGAAMGLKLVYGYVPAEGSLNDMIDKRARKLATEIVMRTHQNMLLEDQAIGKAQLQENIDRLAYELKHKMHKSLWD